MFYDSKQKFRANFKNVFCATVPKHIFVFYYRLLKSFASESLLDLHNLCLQRAGDTAPNFWRIQKNWNANAKPVSFIYQKWLPCEEEVTPECSWRLEINSLAKSIQIGIKYLIFQKIILSSKLCSTAIRLESSHVGNLLTLQNLQKCIMGKFSDSIQTPTLMMAKT